MKKLTFVALALVGLLVACAPAAQFTLNPPSPTPAELLTPRPPETEALFRSDEFHLEISLPPGWAAVEGPQYLAKPFSGWAAFNSWGEPGFWITEVEKKTADGTSYSYNPRDIMERIPEGGAYLVLIDHAGGPPFMEENYGPERVQNDLADLWRDQDCRREGDPIGFTMLNFYKWGRLMRLEVYCARQATDETAAQVNYLLASWRLDAVPAGDVGWASVAARDLLPAAVEPRLFPYLTDGPTLSSSQRDKIVRMTQSEKPAEDRVIITFMVRWNEPPLTSTSWDCPSDRCHWWRIEARPDGEVVLVDEGGAPLSSPTPTLTRPSPPTTAQSGELLLLPSPDGRWTAILSREAGSLELEDPQGVKQTVFPAGSTVNDAQWSADGTRLTVASTNLPKDWQYGDEAKTPPEIHFLDFDGDAFLKAETFYRADGEALGGRITLGAWSPDNLRILFWLGSMSASIQADGFPLWVLDLSDMQATRLAEVTLVNPGYQSWAPDGSALAFTNGGYRSAQVNKWLSLYEVASGQVTSLIATDELVPGQVAWSPAGIEIAFAAVEASQTGTEWADWMSWENPAIQARRIYIFDRISGDYQRLNAAEAYQDAPRWSADGEMLYYVQMDGDQAVIMAADPATGAAQPLPGCQAPRPSGAGYYGQTDWKDVYESCPETSARNVRPNSSIKGGQTYTDPAGQFRVSIPAGWRPGDAEGVFSGPDGALRTGYLPEMAFMDQVYRVCERLANTPGGPARKVILSPGPDFDACTLVPYAEMSIAVPRLVVANRAGRPEQRYFFLETDQEHLETIAASLQLLNAPAERESFPYPAGPMRPNDEAFWEQTSPQPSDLTVEEYAVADASLDDPTHLEFMERIPDEVFQKRAAWRGGLHKKQLAGNNTLLKPFGYSLRAKEGSEMELYELHRGEDLLLDEINEFWPVSVNASASDFALVLGVLDGSYRLVRRDTLEDWDMATSLFIPPVFSGDDLLTVRWDDERSQAQVREGDGTIVSFASVFLTGSPVKGLWSWQGHWLLEVDGFLIRDGENLNERLGFEEIFGWQLLNGKPFYYFRRGPRVGISYDGQVLPVYYDDIVHYRCCEPAAFNNAGNEAMVWFYGLREGTWYYVEIGAY